MGILFPTIVKCNLFLIDKAMHPINIYNMRGKQMTEDFMEIWCHIPGTWGIPVHSVCLLIKVPSMSRGIKRPEEGIGSSRTKLQTVVNHMAWVLGTNLVLYKNCSKASYWLNDHSFPATFVYRITKQPFFKHSLLLSLILFLSDIFFLTVEYTYVISHYYPLIYPTLVSFKCMTPFFH